VTGIYGILQHLGIDWIEWYPKEPRIMASMGNPTFFAAYLVLLLPVAINFFVAVKSSEARIGLGILSGLLYLCLLFTYTRAAWLGLLVAVAVNCLLLWKFVGWAELRASQATKYAAVLAVILVTLSGIAVVRSPLSLGQRFASSFQTREISNVQRLMIWEGAWKIFRSHPVVGAGVGTFLIHVPEYQSPQWYGYSRTVITDHAHNEFLETMAEAGSIGLAVFLWLAVTYVWVVVRVMRTAPEQYWRYLASGLLAGLIAFMIQNLAGVTMRWVFGGMFFWLWLALTVVAGRHNGSASSQLIVWNWPQSKAEQWPRGGLVAAYCALAVAMVLGAHLIIRPFQSEMHLKRGKIAAQESQWQLADDELSRAIRLNRYSLASYYQLGHVVNMAGQFERATEAYQTLTSLAPDYARVHYNLGAVFTNRERHAEAAAEYEQAARLEDSPGNHMALAEAYAQIGKDELAVQEATKAVQIAEKGGPYVQEKPGDMHMRRGRLHYDQEQFEKAAANYQKVAELKPKHKLAHFHLGNCYRKMGELQQAIDEYEIALELDPNDGRIYTNLGAVYFDLGQWDQAIGHYESALEKNSNDAYAHFNLGLAYLNMGQTEPARKALGKAAQFGGQQPVGIQAQAALERLEVQ